MALTWFILHFLLKLFCGVSCDGEKTDNTYVPEIPTILQHYSQEGSQCMAVCLVSSVGQAQLSWLNGSVLLSSLTISDFNTRLFLEMDYQDKNKYSCVLSSPAGNQTTFLNIHRLCQSCSEMTGENATKVEEQEGHSITFPANITKHEKEDDVQWLYEENTLIARLFNITESYFDSEDGRFGNRLKLDNNTGSLTISNIGKIHSGHFKLKIKKKFLQEPVCQGYSVTVHSYLPLPVITRNSSQCSSTSNISKCDVTCSVTNVMHVSLSWYKENSLIFNMSVFELNSTDISLPLEVEYQDTNSYKCVANNSFDNKTTKLNIDDLCGDHSQTHIGAIIGGVVFVLFLVGVSYKIVKYLNRRPSQEDVSIDQDEANDAPAQNNGASSEDRPDSTAHEGTRLILNPSSQRFMSTNLNCLQI